MCDIGEECQNMKTALQTYCKTTVLPLLFNNFQNLEHVVNTLNKIERLLGLGGESGTEEELSGDLVIA